ncbi:beta-propeller fold lactonase family protein [Streptomyces sp. NPDC005480]|uniref:beta-propeller fold lactonase family protein n=1 Tax=Streptomyces sp. NPDC005480 TaxID=3154880 RepID=UPI0033B1C708
MTPHPASRRTALALGAGAVCALSTTPARAAGRPQPPATARFAYVGCYTTAERKGHGKGIAVFRRTAHPTVRAGRPPGDFTTDPTGSVLYAANQASDSISAFHITRSGHLRQTGNTIRTGSPACIVFATRPTAVG